MLIETRYPELTPDEGLYITDIETNDIEWMANTKNGMMVKLASMTTPIELNDTIGGLFIRQRQIFKSKLPKKVLGLLKQYGVSI